ncbi:MAG: TolC family outer membrane protein [Burkholderiales bacterium]|nr:TolC family outer membrane protein [Burkholderiales bacterium]
MPVRPARHLRPAAPALLGLAAACALLAPGWAAAQSLKDLYDAARGYDASFLGARALLDSAEYRVEQVRALNRPQVGLQISDSRANSNTPYSTTLSSHSTTLNGAITASQNLYNKVNNVSITQAEKSAESARADFASAEQDLIVRLAQAYFDVLAAQDTLTTTRANKTAITEQLASAKRNFEVGTATITDTREAQARFDLAAAQEIAATNDLQIKRIALDQLVGRTGVEPKGLATPVALPPVNPVEVDAWVARADAEHPSIRKAAFGLEVAQLENEKARAGHQPTVTLSGSYGSGRVSVEGALASPPMPYNASGTSTTSSIAVTLNVPLYSGHAVSNRIKETALLEEKARDDLLAARRGVAQGTRQAFFGVKSLLAQVGALEAAESSSRLALEATQLGYKVGVRVNLDVLNAQTQLFSTERDLAKARYDTIVGGLKLRQASGQLGSGDVDAVNVLLAK